MSGESQEAVTREELESAILSTDPQIDRDSDEFKAQMVMLASASIGTNVAKIAKLTGVNYSKVSQFGYRLRKNGIWRGRKVYANWADPEEGGVAFNLDICVALGWMDRAA